MLCCFELESGGGLLFCNYLLQWYVFFENGTIPAPFTIRVLFQISILTCLAVPTVMLYTAQEVQRVKREEFMMAATVLGGVNGIDYVAMFGLILYHLFSYLLPSNLLVCCCFLCTLVYFNCSLEERYHIAEM